MQRVVQGTLLVVHPQSKTENCPQQQSSNLAQCCSELSIRAGNPQEKKKVSRLECELVPFSSFDTFFSVCVRAC